ncbi:unnamed protein product [Caenorhabditis angaria]|uniref:Saposin B-type domain-containing protein n=1 Tax=Caenorhabditis angaria TaxID=860376 RepID=A0A9P1MUZ8_9PELO|nr:unnamed protein product [Caenorhabditis angaria]
MNNLLLFLGFSILFISPVLTAATKPTTSPKKTSGGNGLDEISGDTNLELFKKYRCRVCEDIMVDNLELVDGELIINEKVAVKICETFMTKVLHNQLGGVVCKTVVRSKLDEIIRGLVSTESEVKMGKLICTRAHLCEK